MLLLIFVLSGPALAPSNPLNHNTKRRCDNRRNASGPDTKNPGQPLGPTGILSVTSGCGDRV